MDAQEKELVDQAIIDGWMSQVDSVPLMHALAKMAGIYAGHFRRMVLVLDVDHAPMLHTEGFLNSNSGIELPQTKLEVCEAAMIVETTSVVNKQFRTCAPVERVRESLKELTDKEFIDEFRRRKISVERIAR